MDLEMLAFKMFRRSKEHEAWVLGCVQDPLSVKRVLEDVWTAAGEGRFKLVYRLPGNPKGRATLVMVLEQYGYHVENEAGELRVEWNEAW